LFLLGTALILALSVPASAATPPARMGTAPAAPGATKAPAAPGATKTPGAPPAATKPEAGQPAADTSARTLFEQLQAEAVRGKLTDRLLALFRDFTRARVLETYVPGQIPQDFWDWIIADPLRQEIVLVGLHPESEQDIRILGLMNELRKEFGARLDAYPHLATAFAVVYGSSKGKTVRDPFVAFTAKERPVPTMIESCRYYLDHEKDMKMSLRTTPWPMLAYVVDNDLPIDERVWALNRYGAKPPAAYGKIYYELEYDYDKREGKPKIGDRPMTLQNLLTYGGVCAEQAYYASRVLKSMGVPALYDVGAGERGGHAWLAWVGRDTKGVDLLFSGRFDYDKYYTGAVYDPVIADLNLDRFVQLQVAALTRSWEGYQDATAACRIYMSLPKEERGKVAGLLEGAVQKNPYCSWPWRIVAYGVKEGFVPQKQGERMYDGMLKQFAQFPDLTFDILHGILEPRLNPADKPRPRDVQENLAILEKAFTLYEKCERPDLSVRLRLLQGQYLEAAGRREDALKLLVKASEAYVTAHFGFTILFDAACRMMDEDKKTDMKLKYMKMVADKVPQYQSAENEKFGEVNPTYKFCIKAYAVALRSAGRGTEADAQEARLDKKKGA
jgi:hypothetical protein